MCRVFGLPVPSLVRASSDRRYGQKLERHIAVQPLVMSAIHHTHASATELFQDAIVGNGFAGGDHSSATSLRTMKGTSGAIMLGLNAVQVNVA